MNRLTSEKVRESLAQPVEGRVFSLAHLVSPDAPTSPNRPPVWRQTTDRRHPDGRGSAGDLVLAHTHSGTHIDALCHYWGDDEALYNGRSSRELSSAEGSPHLGIENVSGIVTRGVVLDLRAQCPSGTEAHGYELSAGAIEGAASRVGIEVAAGDVVLLATGWSRQLASDPETYFWGEPGIGPGAAQWLADRGVIAVGSDNWAVEAVPPAKRGAGLVVHQMLLNQHGIYLIENLVLEDLCDAVGSSEGIFLAAPIRLTGGTGSPLNPLFVC